MSHSPAEPRVDTTVSTAPVNIHATDGTYRYDSTRLTLATARDANLGHPRPRYAPTAVAHIVDAQLADVATAPPAPAAPPINEATHPVQEAHHLRPLAHPRRAPHPGHPDRGGRICLHALPPGLPPASSTIQNRAATRRGERS